ncbi:MAG: DUF2723 domain-containing protein [Bacteroidota bacterium]
MKFPGGRAFPPRGEFPLRTRPGPPRRDRTGYVPPLWWSLAPAAAALCLYGLWAPPVSGDKDGSEFTLVLALNGIPHPTGYPLYSLLGHLFVRGLRVLGTGAPHAANLWSAAGGAVAVFFLHASVLLLAPAGEPAGGVVRSVRALVPVALFSLNPLWTYETTSAEVYAWHLAWTSGCVFLYVRLIMHADAAAGPLPARRWALWGLVCGAGAAHHATWILVALPLTVHLILRGRGGRRRAVAAIPGLCLPPLAGFGFIAWRAFHPAAWQWPALGPGWGEAWEHVRGAAYGGFLGSFAPSGEQAALLASYLYPFLFPFLASLAGAAWLCRSRNEGAPLGVLLLAAVLSLAFAFSYGVPDPGSYFLTPLALGSLGLLPLLERVGERSALLRTAARVAWAGLFLLTAFLAFRWTETAVERARVFGEFDRLCVSMWRAVPEGEVLVVWPSDMHLRLVEYQILRGERPDVFVLNPFLLRAERPRREFVSRFGFDPSEGGGGARTQGRYLEHVMTRLRLRSPVPVVVFDPERASVRLLGRDGS